MSLGHILLVLVLLWLSYMLLNLFVFLRPRTKHSLRSVAILVLGDIGRSPRMMYHAESFAENEFQTHLIGYRGSRPIPALERLPLVKLRYLPELPDHIRILPFIIHGPLKVLHQTISILSELLVNMAVPPEFILVQNPPSIPSLFVVWLVSRVRGCKVIIDWHNLGYSILALKLGNDHFFVRIYKWLESTFGRSAFAHLFVTQALHDHLVHEWNLKGKKVVLHDRPPRHFHRANPQEMHELFVRLVSIFSESTLEEFLPEFDTPYSTPFTDTSGNPSESSLPHASAITSIPLTEPNYSEISPPALRSDRPALIVSSTSWTPDEDFGILLDALKIYEAEARSINQENGNARLPKLLMVITGKGDKDAYMEQVATLHKEWKFVRCISVWLEAVDYPTLLGSADLGVSLHSSSSKMDLPMKVVDMFGCGLPVCALGFECLDELVIDGLNGLVFKDSEQLAKQLVDLLKSFPESDSLSSLSSTVQAATQDLPPHQHADGRQWQWGSWSDNWARAMKPLILRDVSKE